eukprot:SAG22_NODE_4421_length_1274_cov_3.954894_2_plen_28_part_01
MQEFMQTVATKRDFDQFKQDVMTFMDDQ